MVLSCLQDVATELLNSQQPCLLAQDLHKTIHQHCHMLRRGVHKTLPLLDDLYRVNSSNMERLTKPGLPLPENL